MALEVQKLTLSELHTEIRRRMGETTEATSHMTDAEITIQIQLYQQGLTAKVSGLAGRPVMLDMYRTEINSAGTGDSNLTVASGSSTVELPINYDHYISFWDKTQGRPIRVVENVDRFYREKFFKAFEDTNRVGAPRYIEILDFRDVSANTNPPAGTDWKRYATLWPSTPSGITPSIKMTYYRVPHAITSDSDTGDIDYRYQDLLIYGPLLSILRSDDPAYERYQAAEKELLAGLVSTARAV